MERSSENRIFAFYLGSIALFLGLGLIGIYYISLKDVPAAATSHSEDAASPSGAVAPAGMAFVDLPRVTTSLGGVTQVHIDISLEVATGDVSAVEGFVPQIMDRLNVFFPKANVESLNQPTAMTLFRKDALYQVNSIGIPVTVHDLLFRAFIIM